MFECSTRDFFECQNIVETCWFGAFFTQFRLVFECQKFRGAEFLMLELAFLCLSVQSVFYFTENFAFRGDFSAHLFSCVFRKGHFLWDARLMF